MVLAVYSTSVYFYVAGGSFTSKFLKACMACGEDPSQAQGEGRLFIVFSVNQHAS